MTIEEFQKRFRAIFDTHLERLRAIQNAYQSDMDAIFGEADVKELSERQPELFQAVAEVEMKRFAQIASDVMEG